MLQFNPYLRPNVEQCLASPYFDKVRKFSVVKHASKQVVLPMELKKMNITELRAEFSKMVNDYQKSKSASSSVRSRSDNMASVPEQPDLNK
jgi:hypothetical protein